MTRRFSRVAAALLIVCVGCAGIAVAESPVVRSQVEIEGYPTPDVPERIADNGYFYDVVLVGDSLASGISLYDVMPELDIYATVGLSVRNAMKERQFTVNGQPALLWEALAARQPRAVYLWLGVNGVAYTAAAKVLETYNLLLNQLIEALPNTVFCVLELSPVQAKAKTKRNMLFTNKNIDAFNAGLYELAKAHNVYILPINALLRDKKGMLASSYGANDGYHMRRPGYNVMVEYLYTHTVPLR